MSKNHGTPYILARDAAARCSLSRDYVTRLAREGKIEGKRTGNAWHVSEASLREFCDRQGEVSIHRRKKLADARRKEYGRTEPEASGISEGAAEAKAEAEPEAVPVVETMRAAVHQHLADKKHIVQHLKTAPLYAMSPMLDFAHRATSLVAAVSLVAGAYMFLSPPPLHTALGVVRDVALGAAAAILSAHE